MASGTDSDTIISVNQTSDKAVSYLRSDGSFTCIPKINEPGTDYDLYELREYFDLRLFAILDAFDALGRFVSPEILDA